MINCLYLCDSNSKDQLRKCKGRSLWLMLYITLLEMFKETILKNSNKKLNIDLSSFGKKLRMIKTKLIFSWFYRFGICSLIITF